MKNPTARIIDRFEAAAHALEGAVTISPKIMSGAPCLRGTRIPVYSVLDLLADGVSQRRVLKWFPELQLHDVSTAIRFAQLVPYG